MGEECPLEARSLLAYASEEARGKTRNSHGEEIAIDCGIVVLFHTSVLY